MRAFTTALLLTIVALGATACGQSNSSAAAPGTDQATASPEAARTSSPSEAGTQRSEASTEPSKAVTGSSEAAGDPSEAAGSGGGGKPADALTEGKVADASERIALRKSLFTTEQLQVPSGTTVAWVNRDPYGHTVTFDPILDSGVLDAGARYAVTFNEPGTYGFICTVHPAIMSGEITVKG